MTPKFLFNSGQNYRLLYGLWFPSLPFKTHHLFPPKWHWFTRAHCLVLPQASTSDLLTSLAIADLVAGLLAVPLFIIVADPRKKILPGVLYDCVDMFAGKSSMFTLAVISLERTSRYCSAATTQASDLGSLYHCYSYSLDSFIYGHINSGVATFLCLDKEGFRHRCYHQLINANADVFCLLPYSEKAVLKYT